MQKRLNILHLSYDHPNNPWCGGGGAQRVWEINRRLSQQHYITMYCGSFPGAESQEFPFKVRFVGDAKTYKGSRLRYIFGTRRINPAGYDLIVDEFSAFSPALMNCNGIPRITVVHYFLGIHALRFRPVLGLIAIMSEKLLLLKRNKLIFVSEHLKENFKNTQHSIVVHPGVSIPDNLPESSEEYVLFIGRLDVKIKGLDTLIKAWASLPDAVRILPLHIVGGGDQTEIKRLIKKTGAKDIHLSGHMNHDKTIEAMNRAAFICIPSRMEGAPLVLFESLALGKPIIVSTIPIFKGIIKDDISGILFSTGDYQDLAKAIEMMFKNENIRKRLAANALQMGREFKWDSVAETYERVYWDIVQQYH